MELDDNYNFIAKKKTDVMKDFYNYDIDKLKIKK